MSIPTQALPEEAAVTEGQRDKRLERAVCASVMSVLGRPRTLFQASAVHLWGNRYRVNVLTGADAVSVVIAHSFFVEADTGGGVIDSVPALERRY